MALRSSSLGLSLAALLLMGTSCSRTDREHAQSSEEIRRVVVIHLDTTRADALGCYGGIAQTPSIDALARRGMRYTNSIAPVPLTSPSIASFMTGRLATGNGVYTVGGLLGQEYQTLAEVLRRHGFATGGFTSNVLVANRASGESAGYDQGFDVFDAVLDDRKAPPGVDPRSMPRNNAALLTKQALGFIDEHREGKFFLWMLYVDPHAPYAPPPPYDKMYRRHPGIDAANVRLGRKRIGHQAFVPPMRDSAYYVSRYYGEISLVDKWVGEIVRAVDALEGKTLFVITADHGESLGDFNDWFTHGKTIRHPNVDVPLILVCDGKIPASVSSALVANVDIAPTVLELLGLASDSLTSDGRSLAPTFAEKDPWPERMIPLSVGHGGRWRGVRSARFSLLTQRDRHDARKTKSELFDRTVDPREERDVSTAHPHELQALLEFQRAWFDPRRETAPELKKSEDYEMVERLRSLGYVQ